MRFNKAFNKLEALYTRKRGFICLVVLQCLLLCFLCAFNKILYATNDDTTMIAIAGGGYGAPSAYIINMHIALGWVLKELFLFFPGINWVTILFMVVYVLAFILLDIIVVYQCDNYISYLWKSGVMLFCFDIALSVFTFTVVAYMGILSGIIALIYLSDIAMKAYLKVGCYFWAGINLILGILIRAEAFQSLAIVMAGLVVIEIVRYRKFRVLCIEIICCLLMIVSIKSNFAIENANPLEKEFLDWGELRSEALDCKVIPYDDAAQKEGITQAEYNSIYNAFYYVKDAISKENLQKIKELNNYRNKYNYDIMGFIKVHFSYLYEPVQLYNWYKTLFLFVILISVFFMVPRERAGGFLIWGLTISAEFLFYFIGRNLDRVVMPTYLFAIIIFLCMHKSNQRIEKMKKSDINYASIVSITWIVILLIGTTRVSQININDEYTMSKQTMLTYMEENSDVLYLAGTPNAFNINTSRSIWRYAGENVDWNLIGNWETYSLVYYELIEQYDINDPNNTALEAINNSKINFIFMNNDSLLESQKQILNLIEQYSNEHPRFELVQTVTRTGDKWQVYKLVH